LANKINLGDFNDNGTSKITKKFDKEGKAVKPVDVRFKVHQVYKTADGKRLPSVTTILGLINKPYLVEWAWKMGTEGIDYKKVRDNAGTVGTIAHYLVLCHLKGLTPDLSSYSQMDIDKATKVCFKKYLDWEKENKIEPILIEHPMVSEIFGYGGTIDCLAKLNGELILIDHKTAKGIYPEMFTQLSAYVQLLKENNYEVVNSRILRIGRDDAEGFEQKIMVNLENHWNYFYHLLQAYKLQNIINRKSGGE
jgi:hypothetical protein